MEHFTAKTGRRNERIGGKCTCATDCKHVCIRTTHTHCTPYHITRLGQGTFGIKFNLSLLLLLRCCAVLCYVLCKVVNFHCQCDRQTGRSTKINAIILNVLSSWSSLHTIMCKSTSHAVVGVCVCICVVMPTCVGCTYQYIHTHTHRHTTRTPIVL